MIIINRFLHFYILEEEIEKNHFLEAHYSMISQFEWIIENLEDQNKYSQLKDKDITQFMEPSFVTD